MFSTCIHCAADLGRNEAFEVFPIGTRLAFDPARGRLWVVCRGCDRWNLSPLDERWETVEAAERRFRDSRLRVSTDNIGLARLKEGVDLIRIGDPQRPEMAAWRYGDTFGKRRQRQMMVSGAAVAGAAAIFGGMVFVGVSVGSFAGLYANRSMWDVLLNGPQNRRVGLFTMSDGTVVDVRRKHARMSALLYGPEDAPLQLKLESVSGTHVLVGEEAMRAAVRLMPTVNRFGGKPIDVRHAVTLLEEAGDPRRVLSNVQERHGAHPSHEQWNRKWSFKKGREQVQKLPGALHSMPAEYRLAFEMALHEESERRAMDGELADLERAWRESEEIAKIADDMFVTPAVDARVSALHEKQAQDAAEHR